MNTVDELNNMIDDYIVLVAENEGDEYYQGILMGLFMARRVALDAE